MKRRYTIVIDWFVMSRHPQTIFEKVEVIAATADDAVAIAKVRYGLPFSNPNPNFFEWKKLHDVFYEGDA